MSAIEINSKLDVVLRPISGLRGKRNANLRKGDLYAIVWLNEDRIGEYCHPELNLVIAYETRWDNRVYMERDELLTVRYQRNVLNTTDQISRHGGSKVSGFMVGNNRTGYKWSYSYAPRVQSDTGMYMDSLLRRHIAACSILERASEVVESDERLRNILSKRNDDLLMLIAGLQRVGVTIIIRNGRMNKRIR